MPLSIFRNKLGNTAQMTFVDHLDALRAHLFRSVLAIIAGAILVAVYNNFVIHRILMGPTNADFPTYGLLCKVGQFLHLKSLCLQGTAIKMQSTNMSTQFSMFFSVILIGGFIVAFPFVFREFWRFVKPALTKEELRNTSGVIFWVSLLFFLGVMFGFFVIAPYTVHFFANFQIDSTIENRWTINSYIDTLVPLILGSGLAFQLPLAVFFLTKIGVVRSSFLKKKRKHAIVIMLVVAGVITPPDVLSQIVVTLPLVLLYEISIVLARRVERRQNQLR